MDSITQKFWDKFIDEANELLDRLEKDILELESNPTNKELIESAFRVMHTLKGASAMFGFEHISEFTHHYENIFQSVREGKLHINTEINSLALASIDHIRKLINDEKLENVELQHEHAELLIR